jgi:aconitase A
MFREAKAFNAPIYHWENTSSISNTQTMFQKASKFNQEIRTWDMTTALSNNSTTDMFTDATAFQNDPPRYTSVDTPQLAFWGDNFATYTVKAEDLSWSDVDVTYYKNSVYN